MNRWKWQTISDAVKALIGKGQYGYATLIMLAVILSPIALACVAFLKVAR